MGLTDVGTRGSLLKGMKKVSAYFRSKPSSVYYRKGKLVMTISKRRKTVVQPMHEI